MGCLSVDADRPLRSMPPGNSESKSTSHASSWTPTTCKHNTQSPVSTILQRPGGTCDSLCIRTICARRLITPSQTCPIFNPLEGDNMLLSDNYVVDKYCLAVSVYRHQCRAASMIRSAKLGRSKRKLPGKLCEKSAGSCCVGWCHRIEGVILARHEQMLLVVVCSSVAC